MCLRILSISRELEKSSHNLPAHLPKLLQTVKQRDWKKVDNSYNGWNIHVYGIRLHKTWTN